MFASFNEKINKIIQIKIEKLFFFGERQNENWMNDFPKIEKPNKTTTTTSEERRTFIIELCLQVFVFI